MKKVFSVIIDILAWILLIIAFTLTLMVFASERNNGVATLLGFMPMSVESDSMSPTFKKGDLIIVKKIDDLYSLQKDDVITFYTIVDGARIVNTHRIVEVNEFENTRSFVTRGDNNSIDDDLPAYASDILGKWTGTKISGAGKIFDFLRTKKGFFICVLIPIAIFFIFELYKFISALIEAKQIKLTEEDEEEIKRKAVEEYLAAQKGEDTGAAQSGENAEAAQGDNDSAAQETTSTET